MKTSAIEKISEEDIEYDADLFESYLEELDGVDINSNLNTIRIHPTAVSRNEILEYITTQDLIEISRYDRDKSVEIVVPTRMINELMAKALTYAEIMPVEKEHEVYVTATITISKQVSERGYSAGSLSEKVKKEERIDLCNLTYLERLGGMGYEYDGLDNVEVD
jgi:hypothetical protein